METRDQIIQSIKDDFNAWEATRKAHQRDIDAANEGKPVDKELARDNVQIMERLSRTWAKKLRSLINRG